MHLGILDQEDPHLQKENGGHVKSNPPPHCSNWMDTHLRFVPPVVLVLALQCDYMWARRKEKPHFLVSSIRISGSWNRSLIFTNRYCPFFSMGEKKRHR